MVLWFFHTDRDTQRSLQEALESHLISHVILYTSNRWTGVILEDPENRKKLSWAIQTCKEQGVKTIFVRNLWPTHSGPNLDSEIVFSQNYYIQEIKQLRLEGKQWGTDYVGLDLEAYGGKSSPVGNYLRWTSNYKPTTGQKERLGNVISDVIQKTGQVDFLYPAGSIRSYHFYNIIARLGNNRIAESSYYDNNDYREIRYPYEIFGVYVNVHSGNPQSPHKPYYTVDSVFEKSQRWSLKKGVFIYPREKKAAAVARELNRFSNNLPLVDPNERPD